MVHGKCNCGKRATSEWLITHKDYYTTTKFCDKCRPQYKYEKLTLIDGK